MAGSMTSFNGGPTLGDLNLIDVGIGFALGALFVSFTGLVLMVFVGTKFNNGVAAELERPKLAPIAPPQLTIEELSEERQRLYDSVREHIRSLPIEPCHPTFANIAKMDESELTAFAGEAQLLLVWCYEVLCGVYDPQSYGDAVTGRIVDIENLIGPNIRKRLENV